MLINFKFSNFKSFKDTAEFSMEPLTNNGTLTNVIETGFKKAPHVYRTSAIFGANASGKSNFIDAMGYLRYLVESSYLKRVNDSLDLLSYKLNDKIENTIFECEFIKNNIAYKYFVELNDKEIVTEEAYYTELEKDKREKCLFKRTLTDFNSPYGLDKEIAKQTIQTRLLISELVNNRNNQDKYVLDIYNWFVFDVVIPRDPERLKLMDNASLEKQTLQKKTDFLNKAGISIARLVINTDGLFAIHQNEVGEDVVFDFETEESEGTIILFTLSKDILPVLEDGKILFVDELDNSLHPHLVKYVVGLFNNPKTNPKGAQLVFTSHAQYLMDGDNLTRDQIWFVSKENGYSSELYSLSDFKQIKRKRGTFYNEYMYGIFGAVPRISED